MKSEVVSPHTITVREIPPLVTISEAGELLRFRSAKPIYDMLFSGELRSTIIRSKRLITGESISAVLRSGEQATYAATRESPRKKAA